MSEPKIHNGRYVDLIEGEGGLTIKLNDEGREELAENMQRHKDWPDFVQVYNLTQDFTGNGWMWLAPEAIGALTDCRLLLSDDATLEDNWEVTVHGSIWWHERYQIEDAAKQLSERGELFFIKA